jgi:hypothetical protein
LLERFSSCWLLPSIAEERHHLPNELLRAVRLLEEAPGRGQVGCIAGREEHAHIRTILAGEAGSLEPVETRHDDIGEEEPDPGIALEKAQRGLAIGSGEDLEPLLLEDGDGVLADVSVVVDDQDLALPHQCPWEALLAQNLDRF